MRVHLVAGAAALTAVATGNIAAAPSAAAGSAQTAQRSYEVSDFEKIVGTGSNHFVVATGARASVRATGPALTLERFEVVVEDRELRINLKKEYRNDRSSRKLAPATYTITLPRIRAATLAGSGDMSVDRVDAGAFSAVLAGSGKLRVDNLAVEEANLTLAGSGELTVSGTARSSDVSIAGSGKVQARGLRSRTASVAVAGSGDTALTVSGDADISIVGSGDVDIAGTTRCEVSKMGSGRATCRG